MVCLWHFFIGIHLQLLIVRYHVLIQQFLVGYFPIVRKMVIDNQIIWVQGLLRLLG